MNFVPSIFIPCTLGLIVFALVFFKYPRWAIAGLIIAKPIIDTTWHYYLILNINFLKIYAGAFVILGVIYLLYHRMNLLKCPIDIAWCVFIIVSFISIFFISASLFIDKIEYFLRITTGFVAMLIFYQLFMFEKDKKIILSIFTLSGTVPIIIWLSQIFSITPATSVAGISNELTRIKGPYHDFFNYVFYAIQTIICCLAITNEDKMKKMNSHEFKATNSVNKTSLTDATNPTTLTNKTNKTISFFTKSALVVLIAICVIVIYKSYTKGGWVALPIIFYLYFLLREKFIPALLITIAIIQLILFNPFREEAVSLFRKEIDILLLGSTKWEPDTLFMGRYRDWKDGIREFSTMPLINKLFGAKRSLAKPENDFLNVLFKNGIIGFTVYIFLLLQTFLWLFLRYLRSRDPLFLAAFLILIMYLIIAQGFYLMTIPNFQWFMWGIIGFALAEQKARKETCGISKFV